MTLPVIFFVVFLNFYHTQAYIKDEHYALMPSLFHLDNYDECMLLKDKLYCNFKFILTPLEHYYNSTIWNTIKEASDDVYNYRHDILRHGICLPKTCPKVALNGNISKGISECYNEKFKHLNLKGEVSDLKCKKSAINHIDAVDIAIGTFFAIYLTLILTASLLDQITLNPQETTSFFSKVITSMSISKNWNRLKTIQKTPDIERFKCFQGIRVYNMGLVVLTHMLMLMLMMPVANTKLVENVTDRFPTVFLASGPLSVSTYFMMSSWLLVHGLLTIFKNHKQISVKTLILVFVKRYLRLTPTLAVVIAFHCTWLRHMGDGPNWDHYVGKEVLHCRQNWWTNLLYVNNYVNIDSMCLLTTWYMALDTQYFIILLAAIFMIKKHPKCVWWLISTLVIIHVCLTFYENYIYDFPALLTPFPESLYDLNHTLNNKQWHVQYVSFFGNIAGPLSGLSLGYSYYKHKERKLFTKKFHHILWWVVSHGLGYGIIIIPGILSLSKDVEHDRFWASFHSGFSRIFFSGAIGFGLFGITFGAGGVVKKILEWPPLYVFGRLTYSAYLVHIPLLLIRNGFSRHPLYITEFQLFFEYLGIMTVTYLAALLVTLLFEMPITQLQKILLPQRLQEEIKYKKNK